LRSIFRKALVRRLGSLDAPPQDLEPGEFYYALVAPPYEWITTLLCIRFTWVREDAAFIRLPTDNEIKAAQEYCQPTTYCYVCALHSKADYLALVRRLPANAGYSQHGVDYHIHDFVYITPTQDGPYEIGQITRVKIVEERETKSGEEALCYSAKVSLRIFKPLSHVDHGRTRGDSPSDSVCLHIHRW
jgi:hypothetical protein